MVKESSGMTWCGKESIRMLGLVEDVDINGIRWHRAQAPRLLVSCVTRGGEAL